jgi:hypothetical protein
VSTGGRIRCRHCGSWEHRLNEINHPWTCSIDDDYPARVRVIGLYDGPSKKSLGRINPDWVAAARAVVALEENDEYKAKLAAELTEAEAELARQPKLPGRVMVAKFAGSCARCGGRIKAGEPIHYHDKRAEHVACAEKAVTSEAALLPAGAEVLTYSDHERAVIGQVCREPYAYEGKERRWIVPISQTSRYIREDGLSFGLNEDSGTLYTIKARLATPEEIAQAEAQLAAKQAAWEAAQARRNRIRALHDRVAREGERPEAPKVTGRDLTPNARYDDDHWTLDAEEGWLWLVIYNGRDGDFWGANNLPGAIAIRLPLDAEVRVEVEALWPAKGV